MKKIIPLLLISIMFLLSSCALFHDNTRDRLMQINNGMTKNEVSSILGSPTNRGFDETFETWEYRLWSAAGSRYRICLIEFENGVVAGMETFFEPLPPRAPEVNVKVENKNEN